MIAVLSQSGSMSDLHVRLAAAHIYAARAALGRVVADGGGVKQHWAASWNGVLA